MHPALQGLRKPVRKHWSRSEKSDMTKDFVMMAGRMCWPTVLLSAGSAVKWYVRGARNQNFQYKSYLFKKIHSIKPENVRHQPTCCLMFFGRGWKRHHRAWLFADTPKGAQANTILYTMVENDRINAGWNESKQNFCNQFKAYYHNLSYCDRYLLLKHLR